MSLLRDPLYVQFSQIPDSEFKPLGAGPSSGGAVPPRKQEPIDARSLGYADPRVTIDMQIARREGEPADNDTSQPREMPVKERVS